MVQNKREWLGYLEIYGSDFNRWPIQLADEEKLKISDMPEFQSALDIDDIIKSTNWPCPSEGITLQVLQKIREMEDQDSQISFPQIYEIMRRPALFLSLLSFFLLVGVGLGGQYNSTLRDRMTYGYFSIGPAYAYGANMSDNLIGVK